MSGDSTTKLRRWIELLKSTDPAIHGPARDQLINAAYGRLRRHTTLILNQLFPNQRGETDEVHQGAMIRLWKALESFRPVSIGAFFELATQHIRYELLDQLRRTARNHKGQAPPGRTAGEETTAIRRLADSQPDPADLLAWAEFHEQCERLPAELREVTDLIYYWDMTQAEAAQLLEIPETTVQSRWRAARVQLTLVMKRTLLDLDSKLLLNKR